MPAVVIADVVALLPRPLLHAKLHPSALAVSVVLEPWQNAVLPEMVTVGNALTVTVLLAVFVQWVVVFVAVTV